MAVEIIREKQLIYCAPVNEITQKWGLYAIPRLWREADGTLVIRFNGEVDTAMTEEMYQAPNLYFVSKDEGKTWQAEEKGDALFGIEKTLMNVGSLYRFMEDKTVLLFTEKEGREAIKGVPHLKYFMFPNREAMLHAYRWGDLPEETKGAYVSRFDSTGKLLQREEVTIDFPEREVLINTEALGEDKAFHPVEERLRPYYIKNPYFWEVTEYNGALIALTAGQHPDVQDRYCPVVYLLESSDGGKTWKKRGTVAEDANMPYGYSADGNESTLCIAPNGDLLCAMRMDISIADQKDFDCAMARSTDGGYTWEKPVLVAESSVTPHVFTLDNGIVVLVYGRPGVHFIYSEDSGHTWSKPVTIIGKTLTAERALGKADAVSKYHDMDSYSNTFVEKLSEDTFLLLYNDMKYDAGDGKDHKAGLVERITLKKMP